MGGPWPPPRATGLLAPSASQLQGDNRGFLMAPCSCTVQWRVFSLPGSSVPGTGLQVPKEYIQFSFHCNKDGIVRTAPPPSSFRLSLCPLLLHLLLGHPAPLSLLDARTGSKWLTLVISLLQNSVGTLPVGDRMGLGCAPIKLSTLTLFSLEACKLQHHKYYQK